MDELRWVAINESSASVSNTEHRDEFNGMAMGKHLWQAGYDRLRINIYQAVSTGDCWSLTADPKVF